MNRKKQIRLTTEQAILKTMETEWGQTNAYLCYYEWNVKNAYHRFLNSEEWKAVSSLIHKYGLKNKHALDLGAGNGIGSYALHKQGFNVLSLEPDPSMLVGHGALKKIISSEGLSIKQVSALGENLPISDNKFGLVYCRQVLHHSKNLQKMAEEITRVLVPGGIFIATREHVIDDEKSKQIFLENHALHKYTQSEGAYKLQQYLDAFEESGLKIIKILQSWDSVINYYPVTQLEIMNKIRSYLIGHYGRLGKLLPIFPFCKRYYQHRLSLENKSPGRMITFVAIKS